MSPNEKGIGRPFSGDERKATMIRLRMEPQEVAELDRIAKLMQTTRSGVIREGLKLIREKVSKENSR